MAKLLKSNGEIIHNYNAKNLTDYQKAVGGYIEIVNVPKNGDVQKVLIVNEEGLLYGLRYNENASLLAKQDIVGDALLMNAKDLY